jgi:hypothetical protein
MEKYLKACWSSVGRDELASTIWQFRWETDQVSGVRGELCALSLDPMSPYDQQLCTAHFSLDYVPRIQAIDAISITKDLLQGLHFGMDGNVHDLGQLEDSRT